MTDRVLPRVFGIIGESLSNTLSPDIFCHIFATRRLPYSYLAFEISGDALRQAIDGIRALGIAGVNVTYPYKERVLCHLDGLDPYSRSIGAVNTIRNSRGRLIGYNTDILGFRFALERRLRFDPKGKHVILLGAGGAARACLRELIGRKARRIVVLNRTLGHARSMVASVKGSSGHTEIRTMALADIKRPDFDEEADILINATSAGISTVERIVARLANRSLSGDAKVMDLNYGRRALSRSALGGCLQYEDGTYMVCSQAAESLRIWTGIKADPPELFDYISGRGIKGVGNC